MKIFKPLIFILLILCVIFIGCSIFYYLQVDAKDSVVQKNNVKICFLVDKEVYYTLNFEEQNRLIELINRGISQNRLTSTLSKDNFSFFEIILFDESKIIAIPYKIEEENFLRIIRDNFARDYRIDALFQEHLKILIQLDTRH